MSPGPEYDNKGPGKRKPLKWFCLKCLFCEWTKVQLEFATIYLALTGTLTRCWQQLHWVQSKKKQRTQPRTCSVCNANPTHVNMISSLTARKLKVHLVLFISVNFIEIKLPRCWQTHNTMSRYSCGTFWNSVCLRKLFPKMFAVSFRHPVTVNEHCITRMYAWPSKEAFIISPNVNLLFTFDHANLFLYTPRCSEPPRCQRQKTYTYLPKNAAHSVHVFITIIRCSQLILDFCIPPIPDISRCTMSSQSKWTRALYFSQEWLCNWYKFVQDVRLIAMCLTWPAVDFRRLQVAHTRTEMTKTKATGHVWWAASLSGGICSWLNLCKC